MFRDLIFYPLAGMVIAAMVFVALSFGGGQSLTDAQIMEDGWDLSGTDLQQLTISPGSNAEYIDEEGGYMRLSQFTPDGQGPASPGVFATLGPDHERAFAGQTLRITLRARAAGDNPLDMFDSTYFPMESRPSGAHEFELGSDWQAYSFEFSPPIVDALPNVDLIAVFPGREGEQTEMDLAEIRIVVIRP